MFEETTDTGRSAATKMVPVGSAVIGAACAPYPKSDAASIATIVMWLPNVFMIISFND